MLEDRDNSDNFLLFYYSVYLLQYVSSLSVYCLIRSLTCASETEQTPLVVVVEAEREREGPA